MAGAFLFGHFCHFRQVELAGAAREKHCRHGAQHDHDVAREVAGCGVFHVQLHALFVGRVAAAFDLPEPCEARTDGAVVAIELTLFGDLVLDDRTRSDDRHFTLQDVEKLGKLVD
jgi:hypothetical protein